MYKIFYIFLFIIFFITGANSDVVKEVKVINNDRITKETILVFADIEIGKNYDSNDLNKILRDLYNTDFFSDISLSFDDGILVVDVKENKIIQNIEFNGIKKKELIEILKKQILSKDKNPFVQIYVKKDIERIRKILKNSGYYFSTVTDQIIENNNDTVNIIFNVEIGEKAYIKSIEFIGDKHFKDRILRNIIVSEETKFWKFITNRKFINPENIELDKRLLKNYYLNKGFYQVVVNDSLVEFTENNDFKLSYNINSGPKFIISESKLTLPDDYDEKDFVNIKKKIEET